MSILKNLRKVHAAVIAQQIETGKSDIAQDLNAAAVAALLDGFGNPLWNSYMAIFADNQDQLDRLTKIRPLPAEPGYVAQMRAYIVANAICDFNTNAFLNNRVDERIDGGQNGEPVVDPTQTNDPAIKALRPDGLDAIPDVHF